MMKPELPNTLAQTWIEEKHGDYLGTSFRVKKTLFSGKSEFQSVDVVETYGHGKMLFNDGLVMISERDEFAYHDMITHVAMFTHPNPERVLVIGGGDGGTAREVLRHKTVKYCRMVEIDELVVNVCKEFIPLTSSCLSDERLTLDINDAVKFVAETDEKFDVVLVDSTDPIGPAAPLFGTGFYSNVLRILNVDGVVVSQGESPFYMADTQESLLTVLNKVFEKVAIYNFSNLTYPGGLWSFTFASNKLHPIKDFNEKRVDESGLAFKYYNKEIHNAAFCLPEFQKQKLKSLIKG